VFRHVRHRHTDCPSTGVRAGPADRSPARSRPPCSPPTGPFECSSDTPIVSSPPVLGRPVTSPLASSPRAAARLPSCQTPPVSIIDSIARAQDPRPPAVSSRLDARDGRAGPGAGRVPCLRGGQQLRHGMPTVRFPRLPGVCRAVSDGLLPDPGCRPLGHASPAAGLACHNIGRTCYLPSRAAPSPFLARPRAGRAHRRRARYPRFRGQDLALARGPAGRPLGAIEQERDPVRSPPRAALRCYMQGRTTMGDPRIQRIHPEHGLGGVG